MDREMSKRILKILTDILCLLLVHSPVPLLLRTANPAQRGLYCYDHTLMAPLTDERLEAWLVVLLGLVIGVTTILITEYVQYRRLLEHDLTLNTTESHYQHDMFYVYQHVLVLLFGSGTVLSLVYIGKYTIGRLSPTFIARCKPKYKHLNCTMTSSYVQRASCTGSDANAIQNARLSFPSLHSTYAVYILIHFMIYTKARVRFPRLTRHMVTFILATLTLYCCLLPVVDNVHHRSDVITGAVLGGLIAITTTQSIDNLHALATAETQTDRRSLSFAPSTLSRRSQQSQSRTRTYSDRQPPSRNSTMNAEQQTGSGSSRHQQSLRNSVNLERNSVTLECNSNSINRETVQ